MGYLVGQSEERTMSPPNRRGRPWEETREQHSWKREPQVQSPHGRKEAVMSLQQKVTWVRGEWSRIWLNSVRAKNSTSMQRKTREVLCGLCFRNQRSNLHNAPILGEEKPFFLPKSQLQLQLATLSEQCYSQRSQAPRSKLLYVNLALKQFLCSPVVCFHCLSLSPLL